MVLGWNVPVGAGYCSALGQAVSCNYNISTPLQPNYDVVSKAWWGAFLTTSWSTCVVSFALIICEYILWYHGSSNKPDEVPPGRNGHHHPVQRTILVLERLINAFSEQQSVAGLSLIVVAGHDGCELSAYIYNLICFQLIMSLISHLNALTNTRNWFGEKEQTLKRGIFSGVIKILPIALTIIMAGIMLGARIGGAFPSYAGALASFPAVCFENTNALAGLESFHDVITKHKSDWANNGFVQYMILVFDLIVVGFIFAIALLKKIKHRPDGFRMRISLILRSASTIATTGTLCWLSVQYILMRKEMESNPEWYDSSGASNQYSYYNVVTWALFASSLITVIKAFSEAYKVNGESNPIDELQGQLAHIENFQDKVDKADVGSTLVTEILNSPIDLGL